MKKFFLLVLCVLLLSSCTNTTINAQDGLIQNQIPPDAVVLTIGGFGANFTERILDFNKSQKSFYLIPQDFQTDEYGNKHSFDEALESMVDSINSNSGPDLLSLDTPHLRSDLLSEGLVDLYPYLEDDSELNKEDILENLRQMLEIDGKLYSTVAAFTVRTMAAKTDIVGEIPGWNIEKMKALVEKNGGASPSFAYLCDGLNFLDIILELSGDDFCDISKKTAYFDNMNFSEILEYCEKMGTEYNSEQIMENAFFTDFHLSCYMDLCYCESILGREITWIGAPSENINGHAFWNVEDTYGITKCCQNTDGAWKFIRQFFTATYQYERYVDVPNQMFPANTVALRYMQEEAMAGEKINGTVKTPYKDRCCWMAEYHPLTPEQVEKITKVITSCNKLTVDLDGIKQSCFSDFERFFNKEISKDDVIHIVQEKSETVLNS